MAFTEFNKSGFHQLSGEIIAALSDLAQTHGLEFTPAGGSLGADCLDIKLRVKSSDTKRQEEVARKEFARYAHLYGLEADDYGLEFRSASGRYKIVGFKPSRPKYPLSAVENHSGRVFKFTRSVIPAIVAAREERQRLAQEAEAAKQVEQANARREQFAASIANVAQF